MKGGKREGAGRPLSPNPANVQVHIKMTPEQHKLFLELGGSKWVKQMITRAKPDSTLPGLTRTGQERLPPLE